MTNLREFHLYPPDAKDLTIINHDIVLWLGDLNYRIDESVSLEDVFIKIENNELEYLRERDQLNIERSRNKVFHGFQEGVLKFNPTYKYQGIVYNTILKFLLNIPFTL
jgi:phosphatidylinositol-bisphosphatase